MKIEILRSIAMIDLSPKPGDVIERPDAEARSLIAAGHAKPAGAAKPVHRPTEKAARRGAEKRGG
jgi:hypothetical protein